MVAALSLLALACTLIVILYAASFFLARVRQPAPVLPFESGLLPQQHAVSRYHARWYAVTILFLAFERGPSADRHRAPVHH